MIIFTKPNFLKMFFSSWSKVWGHVLSGLHEDQASQKKCGYWESCWKWLCQSPPLHLLCIRKCRSWVLSHTRTQCFALIELFERGNLYSSEKNINCERCSFITFILWMIVSIHISDIACGIKFWANYHDKADGEIISNQE